MEGSLCHSTAAYPGSSMGYLPITRYFMAHDERLNSLFFSVLRLLDDVSSNQGAGGSSPSGRANKSRS
jgi:hypothetical protein